MHWIDLAHPYDEAMTHIPAGGPPCIRNIFDIERDPFNPRPR
jgi:kynurenine formamidase